MDFNRRIIERAKTHISTTILGYTSSVESNTENMKKLISQNSWLIAGIQEMESDISQSLQRIEAQIKKLEERIEHGEKSKVLEIVNKDVADEIEKRNKKKSGRNRRK